MSTNVLCGLEPQSVFSYFEQLTRIPRGKLAMKKRSAITSLPTRSKMATVGELTKPTT